MNYMRIFYRYILFYLTSAFFFVLYNAVGDVLFYKIDYGHFGNLRNGLGYIGFYIVLYTPWFLPFLILYNVVVNELFFSKLINSRSNFFRYPIALFLGTSIGFLLGERGISFYIGKYREIKTILVFGLIMISMEITRSIVLHLRYHSN